MNKALVKHLKDYYKNHDTRNFTVLDFVGAFGSPLLALAYAGLFWPEFEEYRGMVFLAEDLDENKRTRIDKMSKETNACTSDIERSFNCFEVPSYFFSNVADTSDDEDEYLAELIAQIWFCKLKRDFPEKKFKIEVLSPEQTGGEIALSVYQL